MKMRPDAVHKIAFRNNMYLKRYGSTSLLRRALSTEGQIQQEAGSATSSLSTSLNYRGIEFLDPEIEARSSSGIVVCMWQYTPSKYVPSPLSFGDVGALNKPQSS